MIRQAWLVEAAEQLAEAGVPDPARDARLLLRWVLGIRAEDLHEALRSEGTAGERAEFTQATGRRAAREPLSHITGTRLFWGREFRVSRMCWTRGPRQRRWWPRPCIVGRLPECWIWARGPDAFWHLAGGMA